MLERNRWLQALIIMLVFIAAIYLGGMLWQLFLRFSDIILTFFMAWLVAYTLNPVADFLVRQRLPRLLAIMLVYLFLLVAVITVGLVIVPPLATQTVQLGRSIPGWVNEWPRYAELVQGFLNERGIDLRLGALLTESALLQRAEQLGTALAQNALGIAQGVAAFIFNTVIVIILSLYFMIDGERFSRLFIDILPASWEDEARYLLAAIDKTFGGFMRGLLIQTAVYAVGTGIVMTIAGLPFVLVVSLFAGAMMVIPFIGSVVAMIPPVILAALTGDWLRVLLVFAGLLVLQQVVLNVISPKVMSDTVGMHPLLIFFAVLLGTKEAGIWGAIFGVPIVGVVYSMVVQLYRQRRKQLANATKEQKELPLTAVVSGEVRS
ncbi:MAG: AI-2E family transporter [Chloroflexota bacterium]|nr:AI-2E family transporter [Dehalococcoidia bacterium]MDW8255078.1 AI-2E family transporter [Chloroflexota bacterium]